MKRRPIEGVLGVRPIGVGAGVDPVDLSARAREEEKARVSPDDHTEWEVPAAPIRSLQEAPTAIVAEIPRVGPLMLPVVPGRDEQEDERMRARTARNSEKRRQSAVWREQAKTPAFWLLVIAGAALLAVFIISLFL